MKSLIINVKVQLYSIIHFVARNLREGGVYNLVILLYKYFI